MRFCVFCFFTITMLLKASAFEGKLTYSIQSGDREWIMECLVKEDRMRAKMMLNGTVYQAIQRDSEQTIIIDEFNKQIYPVGMSRSTWGQKDNKSDKIRRKQSDYKLVKPLDHSKYRGSVYKVDGKYTVEVIEGYGRIHGAFTDQFSSLQDIFIPGGMLFEEGAYMPLKIYKKKSNPILELLSVESVAVDDSVFEIPSSYVRAKMKFRMR